MIQLPIFSCLNSTVLTFKKNQLIKNVYIVKKKKTISKKFNAFYIIDHLPKKKKHILYSP